MQCQWAACPPNADLTSLTLADTARHALLHTASHQTMIRTRMPHQKQRASALGFVIHLYDLKVLTPTSQKEAWQIKIQAVCHVNILVGGFCLTFLLSGAALPLYREVVKKLLWSEFTPPLPLHDAEGTNINNYKVV